MESAGAQRPPAHVVLAQKHAVVQLKRTSPITLGWCTYFKTWPSERVTVMTIKTWMRNMGSGCAADVGSWNSVFEATCHNAHVEKAISSLAADARSVAGYRMWQRTFSTTKELGMNTDGTEKEHASRSHTSTAYSRCVAA